jgi:hypothetical protein
MKTNTSTTHTISNARHHTIIDIIKDWKTDCSEVFRLITQDSTHKVNAAQNQSGYTNKR